MQTVNRSFGTVRRSRVVTDVAGSVQGLPSDYAGGYGSYAMATGAEDRIATLQDEIAALVARQAAVNGQRAKLQRELANLKNAFNNDCKSSWSRKKCDEHRAPILEAINTKTNQYSAYGSELQGLTTTIANKKSELENLLLEQKELAEATSTLAEQGKTPEALRIEAQAEADAVVAEANARAQAEVGSKRTRNLVIILVAVGVLAVTAIILIRKFRKKKSK